MNPDYKALGTKIGGIRKEKGYSQDELSEKINVTRITISNIETGRKAPSLDLLVDIANALDTSLDNLLVDSLTHSPDGSDKELNSLFRDCTPTEKDILKKALRNLKEILIEHGI